MDLGENPWTDVIQAVFSYFNPMVLMEAELEMPPTGSCFGLSCELEGCGTLRR